MTSHTPITGTGTRVLVAPEHIRGRIGRWDDPARKQERADWIASSLRDGHTQKEVAAALGIGQAAISAKRPGCHRVGRRAGSIRYRGLHIGSLEAAMLEMPMAQYLALEASASRHRQSIAQTLVAFWAEAHK